MPRVYLISKRLDPLFGIATGFWAWHLYEKKMEMAPGHTLYDLVMRKFTLWQSGSSDRPRVLKNSEHDSQAWKEINDEMSSQQQSKRQA